MIIEVKIPSPGESINEVEIANWLVEDGATVEKDQEIAEIESDKATLPLIAEKSGKIAIKIKAGETAEVGTVACTIDTDKAAQPAEKEKSDDSEKSEKVSDEKSISKEKNDKQEEQKSQKETTEKENKSDSQTKEKYKNLKLSPLAQRLMQEKELTVEDIVNGLYRISKNDIETIASLPESKKQPEQTKQADYSPGADFIASEKNRKKSEERLSSLRRKLSERLVSVKNETAMLTTFNEVDMSAVMNLRKKYQKQFIEKYDVKAGFMSFFIKATTLALKQYPNVNAMLDGEKIVYYEYADIGIAVQSPKGLMVPVIRNTEALSLAEIELTIKEFAQKARQNRISIDDLSGGTFTITNGGTFGSLLSTPIINPPQSGILGMHNIVERPVAINGKVEIRPMMYIALSYDHRIIDGKSAVQFLITIKEAIEAPYKLLFGSKNSDKMLLGL